MEEEVFEESDEPLLTEEEEKEIYGDIPEEVSDIPQTHGVEENYEVGDKNVPEE